MIKAYEVMQSLIILFLFAALPAQAAEPVTAQTSDDELVKQAQNPIANLISVPLQNNWYFGVGKKSGTVYAGNIEPVIPIKLNDQWNLITRTIMPIVNVPSLFSGTSGATGLGDFNPQFYFSTQSGELLWGVGPLFTLPTATDKQLGAGKFSMGPTAVALTMQGPWVFGALANNQWSVAGWGKN
ncbi:MAG: transporter, partial [Pseudolabrys sp.]